MRRDLLRARNWIRGLVLAVVTMLGLVAIVGSGGGGSLGFPDCGWPCDEPPPPTINIQPPYLTALVGSPVVFKAEASNSDSGRLYQWSRSVDGGRTYMDIVGATGPSYSIAAVNLGDDGAMFQVKVPGMPLAQPAVSHLAVSATPGVVFEDGDFQPAGWIVLPIVGSNPIRPEHSEERIDSGGNPGAFRKMVFGIPQGTGSGYVAYLSLSSTFDPGAQGAVYVIDYAEDCTSLLRNGSGAMFTESDLVIEQGGRTYLSDVITPICVQPTWRGVASRSSLRAQDFRLFDGPACGAGEACPDFSASGLPMRFGYLRTVFGVPGDSITHGIDNWKVTVWRR